MLGGKIHAVGGARRDPLGVHEVYDPATNRRSRANPVPTARDHLAAAALHGRLHTVGGRIYVPAGGLRPGAARRGVLEAFEP